MSTSKDNKDEAVLANPANVTKTLQNLLLLYQAVKYNGTSAYTAEETAGMMVSFGLTGGHIPRFGATDKEIEATRLFNLAHQLEAARDDQ